MSVIRWVCLGLVGLTLAAAAVSAGPPEDRVAALVARMTLAEKVGQMTQADLKALASLDDIATYSLGSVLCGGGSDPDAGNSAAAWAQAIDACQRQAVKSRLAVPILYGVDAVHGHNNVEGAVIFPHNIGLGASRDASLVERAAAVTAREMAGTGARWAFAPCVAVARNERWGRTYESYGEDPELVATMGAAAVRGLQKELGPEQTSVLACAKHFVADGGTTDGTDQGNSAGDDADLRRVHLPGYEAAIRAGTGSIMVSYSSWNGLKMHAEKRLLTDLLKGELGFDGILVSDWAAIDQIDPDFTTAIERSINAGLDMIMIPSGPGKPNNYVQFIETLQKLVQDGRVPLERIDDAVTRILRVKERMGLLDAANYSVPELREAIGSPAHREVARACVRGSLVLLKNENDALPLSKRIKRLHVAGAAADDLGMQCGGWTIDWQGKPGAVTPGGTTLLAALQAALGNRDAVTYSTDGAGAAGADAVLVVIGEPPYAEMMGDRADLSVSAEDRALVKRMHELGVPVITVLYSGRPLILGSVLEDSDALVAAWLPGTEGQGIADVLLGDHPFKGKLPHTWPRTMNQVPLNLGEEVKGEPLFPYGFGLGE